MTQTMTVLRAFPDGSAELTMERMSACSMDCKSCGGCPTPKTVVRVVALNPLGASVGDSVVVESNSGAVILLALITYITPLVFFFLGYAAGAPLAAPVLTAVFALVASFAVLLPVNRLIKRKSRTFYRIISIQNRHGSI